MQRLKPELDLSGFKLSLLGTEKYKHILLLLFWPVYGVLFTFTERAYERIMKMVGLDYYPVKCDLDSIIPFNEFFLIPYMFWFLNIVLVLGYTLFFDTSCFKSTMKFFMITYLCAIFIYFIFPTEQNLRPSEFIRDNFLTDFMREFYQFDTNTNVCPSIHVMGALACLASTFHAKHLDKLCIRIPSVIMAILICASTVFLKQHSVIDVIAALPICAVAYLISFRDYRVKPNKKIAAGGVH